MNKKTTTILFSLACIFMPLSVFAQSTTENVRNFLSISSDNTFLPVLLLIGFCLALFTFFFPRFGLIIMLFFMLISTDMQLDKSAQGRAATIRLEDIILIIVSGGWLFNRAKTRSLTMFRHVPVNKPILMMALVIVLASILGYLQGTLPMRRGFLFTLKRLEYFWLFFMTLNIMRTDREVKIATTVLSLLTMFVSIVGIVQFYLYPLSELVGGGATATSGFGRANTLADFYLIIGGVFMGLIIYAQSRRKIFIYLLVMSLCAAAIIMTKSRGAYVSIPPLIATIVFVSKSRKTVLFLLIGGIVFLAYFLGMMVLSASRGEFATGAEMLTQKHTGDIGNQFESIRDIAAQGPEVDSSFYARYSSWINDIPELIKYPILGHGVGSVPLAAFDCQHVRELHETGGVGFLIFLYMNFAIFMTVLNLFYMSNDPFTKGITCGFLGGHIAMLIHGWSIANFYTIMNMEIFWFTLALIMVLYYNHIQRNTKQNEDVFYQVPLPLDTDS